MSKRDDILNATLDLIHEEGIQSVTFAKIFKRAKVGSGTLYNYFDNKDEIIVELFQRNIKLLESIELPEYYDAMSLIEKFNTLIDHFLTFMEDHSKEYLFVESFSSFPALYKLADIKEYHGVIDELNKVILLGQAQGIFRQMEVELSVQIISGIVSVGYKGSQTGKYAFDEKSKNELKRSCWKALLS